MKFEVKVKTPVNPTEDVNKVIGAVSNMFNYDQLEIGEDYISATGGEESLLKLKEALEKRKIRNTARKIMIKEARDGVIFFNLNKQAAQVGVVNFSDNISPLGDIKLKIETDDVDGFIDWLAPLQE